MGGGPKVQSAPGVLPATPEETQTLNYILDWTNTLGNNAGNFFNSPDFQEARDSSRATNALANQYRYGLTNQLVGSASTGKLHDAWQRNIQDTVGRTATATMGRNLSDAASRGVINSTYMTQMNNDLSKATTDSITDKYADLFKLQQDSLAQGLTSVDSTANSANKAVWSDLLAPLAAQQQYMAPLIQLWSTMYGSRMTPGTQNTVVSQGTSPLSFLSALTPFMGL